MPPDLPNADQSRPADIKLRRTEQQLQIVWRDGHRSDFDAVTLRHNCPCAACRTVREKRQETALPILDPSAADSDPQLTGAELVGQYAIRLNWSDGHDTGMFDFRLLRSLDRS